MITTSKIHDALLDSWSQFQGALKQVESDIHNSYEKLVEIKSSSVDDSGKYLQNFLDSAKETKENLNKHLDDGLQKTAKWFSLASKYEFDELNSRLDAIEARLNELKDIKH